MCVTDRITHFWGGCLNNTSCRQHGWTGNQSLESPTPSQNSLKSASPWKQPGQTNNRLWGSGGAGAARLCPESPHLLSTPRGAKSILCLVWKMKVLVRISMTEGGSTAVAMAKRASWAAAVFPSASLFARRLRHLSRPLKFKAWNVKRIIHHLYTRFPNLTLGGLSASFIFFNVRYQESRCVIKEAAEATTKASFKEGGGALRGGVLRQRAHRIVTAGGVCTERRAAAVLTVARHHGDWSHITTMEVQQTQARMWCGESSIKKKINIS